MSQGAPYWLCGGPGSAPAFYYYCCYYNLYFQQDSLELKDFPDDPCTTKENWGLHLRDDNFHIQFIEMFI